TVAATDLRAGAALILAGLAAEGETRVENMEYVFRGYDAIDVKLRALGADVALETTGLP
ncbi:MAG: UDP-N-acetylglucosamine 1-carboxyvinyltransferase, partial [Synergistaceae bacterium]|nr:UDP-N-acetylglucosamine 1-carboxyvinyltransferase [Synergistaceae bacterium]